jgi:hypothetical protein
MSPRVSRAVISALKGSTQVIVGSLRSAGRFLLSMITHEYIPTEKHSDGLEPFLVSMSNFEGIYGNMSEGTDVFRYATVASESDFWRQVQDRLPLRPWIELPSDGVVHRFECAYAKLPGREFSCVDEVRVRYDASTSRVTVAQVRGLFRNLPAHQGCGRSEYAERVVWPLLWVGRKRKDAERKAALKIAANEAQRKKILRQLFLEKIRRRERHRSLDQ